MISRMRRRYFICLVLLLASSGAIRADRALAADAPRVEITSRVPNEGTLHVIGFLEGTALQSAGIYDHGEKLKDIDVVGTPGSQRINFDFAIEAPSPTMTIQVTDIAGRTASANVMAPGSSMPVPEVKGLTPSEPGGDTAGSIPPAESSTENSNAIEIPRYGGNSSLRQPNPRFVGGVGNPMSNAEITLSRVTPVMSKPGSYEVSGQIAGAGVHRAGIYVNGRPVARIPVSAGTFTPFDVVFPLVGGRGATIRAYGAGNQYVELPINLNGPSMFGNPGAPRSPLANPYGATVPE